MNESKHIDRVHEVASWFRRKWWYAVIVIIIAAFLTLVNIGKGVEWVRMVAKKGSMQVAPELPDDEKYMKIKKPIPGDSDDLVWLAERVAESGVVAGYVWGDYQFNVSYMGWDYADGRLSFSGSVDNVKGPTILSQEMWSISLLFTNDAIKKQMIAFEDRNLLHVMEIKNDPQISVYANEERRQIVNLLDAMIRPLAIKAAREIEEQTAALQEKRH